MREMEVINSQKDYQTLFWVPMLQQTARNVEVLIEDMLDLIGTVYCNILSCFKILQCTI